MKRKTEHNLVFATLVIFAAAGAAFIIGYQPDYQRSYQSYKPAPKTQSQRQGSILGVQTQELTPTGDAFVLSSTASSNYGLAGYLQVSFDRTPNPDVYGRTFVKFNLSSIPSGATINSAKLNINLKSSGCSGVPTPNVLYVMIAIGDWQENTITWSNAPYATGGSQSITSEPCPAANKVLSIDTTNYVKDWFGGVRPNYGFIMRDLMNSTTSYTRFYTARESGSAGAPKLSITYTAPETSSPSSAGSTGSSSGSTNTSEQGNQGTNTQSTAAEQGKEGGQASDKSDEKVNILGKEIKSSTLEAILLIALLVILSVGALAFVFRKELADFYQRLRKKKGKITPSKKSSSSSKTRFGGNRRGERLKSGKKNVSSKYRGKSGSSGK